MSTVANCSFFPRVSSPTETRNRKRVDHWDALTVVAAKFFTPDKTSFPVRRVFLLGKKNRWKKNGCLQFRVFLASRKKQKHKKKQLKADDYKIYQNLLHQNKKLFIDPHHGFPWWNVQMSKLPPHFGGIAHLLPEQSALSDLRPNHMEATNPAMRKWGC